MSDRLSQITQAIVIGLCGLAVIMVGGYLAYIWLRRNSALPTLAPENQDFDVELDAWVHDDSLPNEPPPVYEPAPPAYTP